jgi:Leucine-rich repeat (LRR) protein
LPKLTGINLSYNEFTIFPNSLYNLQNIKQLRIWNNKIKSIPDDISKCKKLNEINLDNNEITYLPDSFHKLLSLSILTLDNNNLDPESILVLCKMQNLKKLNLRNTNISSIPKEIGDLNNIITLDLSENKDITKLPKQMTQLKALNQLGLGNLTQIDWEESFDILSKLPNLRAIGLYGIKKQTMPKGFEKLQQVQTFWLTSNLFDNNEKERIRSLIPTAKIVFD